MGIDLIYANANKEDIGIMRDYTLDLAFGSDENNFECKIVESNHCCEKDFFLYIEGTEYGGIVDDIAVDTDAGEVTYLGRTWHGILNSKVLEPDSGADYLICGGEANSVLSTLIDRMGLNSLFKATTDSSAITISNYKMNRYIGGYDGIVKMLKSVGAKLTMKFNDGFVELSAKPIVDYSKDEQFDTDLIALNIKKKGNVVNHIICLGKGDLKDREVIHIYADEKGNISQNQVFTGLAEVTAVYENTNAADSEELKQGGIDILKNAWASNEIDFDFIDDEESYDIGDIIGAEEHITGTEVAREITKKIVNISNNTVIVSYPTESSGGGYTQTSSGGLSIDQIYPVGSIYMSVNNVNPANLFGGTWEQIKDKFLLSAGDTYSAGSTGGEAQHTLTIDEMPTHNHNTRVNWSDKETKTNTVSVNGVAAFVSSASGQLGVDRFDGGTYNVGGSQPHNNMPPYLAVYVWKRTA